MSAEPDRVVVSPHMHCLFHDPFKVCERLLSFFLALMPRFLESRAVISALHQEDLQDDARRHPQDDWRAWLALR
jgi:hypothetical protein